MPTKPKPTAAASACGFCLASKHANPELLFFKGLHALICLDCVKEAGYVLRDWKREDTRQLIEG